jgi:biopolymer transport protein TolQ
LQPVPEGPGSLRSLATLRAGGVVASHTNTQPRLGSTAPGALADLGPDPHRVTTVPPYRGRAQERPFTGGLVIPIIDATSNHLLLGSQWELLDLLRQTGFVARLVLLVLAAFSVWSWAIMWERRRTFRTVEAETEDFLRLFRAERNLTLVRDRIPEKMRTPLCALFRAGYHELARAAPGRGPDPAREAVGLRNIDRGLSRAAQEETVGLERGLGFLATTASATPFIGLFGTVWGIMNAFHGIGLTGSASLAAVAPGIAEALINTAAGLGAAIPAVVGYNHFLGRIRRMGVQMENFASEFAGEADRILHSRKESPQMGAEGGS